MVGSPPRARNFYVRRALRLFPLFYAVWIFLALYIWQAHIVWRPIYWLYLLYCGNLIAGKYTTIGAFGVAHFWSLAVEEQYYLLWPMVVWRVRSFRKLGWILVGSVIFSGALKILLYFCHFDPVLVYDLLPTHVEGIAMGSLLAIGLRSGRREAILRWAGLTMFVSATLIAILGVAEHGLSFTNPRLQIEIYPLIGLFSCCLIACALNPSSRTSMLTSASLLRFYGRYSYGLYVYSFLFHNVLRSYLYTAMAQFIRGTLLLNLSFVAASFSLLTAISVVSFECFEKRFLLLKSRFQ